MATYYLINAVNVAGNKLLPGDTIDDATVNTSTITAVGGILWPSSDTTVAAAALVAQNAHKHRGANEVELAAIMQGAVDAVQKQNDQAGTVTLAAGTATVNTGITVMAGSVLFFNAKTPGGTMGAHYKFSTVAGGPGTGSFTVTAVDTSGSLVNTDTTVLAYQIIG